MSSAAVFQRTVSVARKEVLHIFRDRQTLMMTMFFPIVELIMLGYAIDVNVRFIPTVALDQANTQESRQLLRDLENSDDFKFVGLVQSDAELKEAIVNGRARVGVKIPEDYSRRLQAGDTAQVQVLVDGSLSTTAGEAVNVSNAVALRDSLLRGARRQALPVDARPRVLFNPDTRSANFFIPGLMCVLCQFMAVTLSAGAIVREKEKGTLEQLFMTPVRPGELIVGKMLPYLILTTVEFCGIAFLMRVVFQVPINGPFWTLLVMTLPFILTMLAWGLWVSTARLDPRSRHANGDGHADAEHFPVRLRLPAGLDAAVLLVGRTDRADDLDDRRRPWRHPARGRLAGVVAARPGPQRHGGGRPRLQLPEIPEARDDVNSPRSQALLGTQVGEAFFVAPVEEPDAKQSLAEGVPKQSLGTRNEGTLPKGCFPCWHLRAVRKLFIPSAISPTSPCPR